MKVANELLLQVFFPILNQFNRSAWNTFKFFLRLCLGLFSRVGNAFFKRKNGVIRNKRSEGWQKLDHFCVDVVTFALVCKQKQFSVSGAIVLDLLSCCKLISNFDHFWMRERFT